jgi:uncharacterized membrane protein
VLSPSPPRLITTGRLVHRGVNGAVSTLGLALSAAGGLTMGLVAMAFSACGSPAGQVRAAQLHVCVASGLRCSSALCGLLFHAFSLVLAPLRSSHSHSSVGLLGCCNESPSVSLQVAPGTWRIVALGLFAGLFGSVTDSVLGATLQFSGYSEYRGKVVNYPGANVHKISGSNILSNNQVNVVSATITAAVTAVLCVAIFGGV